MDRRLKDVPLSLPLLVILFFAICPKALPLLLLGVLVYGICLGALVYMKTHIPSSEQRGQAILVLGTKVRSDGTLVPQLESRLETTLSAYLAEPRLVVCCGAKGKYEPAAEGEVMRHWLINRGVPEDHVLAECCSYNTTQNLKNGIAMLPPETRHITVVTSDFHLPRSMRIVRDMGLSVEGIGSPCNPAYWLHNHTRELLAWGRYMLVKLAAKFV